MLKGLTFKEQSFKSENFALMTWEFFDHHDGIIKNLNITYTNNQIIIGEGFLLTYGYYSQVQNSEIINTDSLNGDYKLIYEIDLSKNNTEIEFNQGSFKLINTSLIQEDLFAGGKLYQQLIGNVKIINGTINSFEKKIQNAIPKHCGTEPPSDNFGVDGDVYYQYEDL